MNKQQDSRFIRFLGGKNLLYILTVLMLLGITIFIFNKVSFVFKPFIVIFSTVAPPAILALIAYYLLNPIVSLFEKLHIRRIWGIIILILGIVGIITGIILLTAPHIQTQIQELSHNLPKYIQEMSSKFKDYVDGTFIGPYYDEAYEWVTHALNNLPDHFSNYLTDAASGIANVASTISHVVIAIVTFPFILFFLLKDQARFKQYCIKLLPPKFRDDADHILKNMDLQVGSYIQGQIIVATCIGILLFIGYSIIGLDYAITLAIVAAVLSVVPYLGPTMAISPAIIIAIVNSPFMLLKLAIVWIAVQFLEGHFISPNIMGKTMKIHPLTIMLTLLVAGNLFGVVGVILGIPGYAILKVIIQYLYSKFKQRYNRFYNDDPKNTDF